jgi:hypothetical protein
MHGCTLLLQCNPAWHSNKKNCRFRMLMVELHPSLVKDCHGCTNVSAMSKITGSSYIMVWHLPTCAQHHSTYATSGCIRLLELCRAAPVLAAHACMLHAIHPPLDVRLACSDVLYPDVCMSPSECHGCVGWCPQPCSGLCCCQVLVGPQQLL